MPVGLGGHFTSSGSINGRTVQFMVDTGATVVALSQGEAERIGLDWRSAPRATHPDRQRRRAGAPRQPGRGARRRGRGGNVEAIVMPAQMPYVLLGNSFLSRFQMRRDNDVLRLERRR